MQILLAIDGSEPAARAAELVDRTPWPAGSRIVIITVIRPPIDPGLGMPGLPLAGGTLQEMASAVEREAQRVADAAAEGLEAEGRTIEVRVIEGRPASVIVDLARALGVDLVVVGSHGYGRVQTALLGSVSSEVAEFARCSVLVARTGRIGSIVLADDGSDQSEAARRLVASMPGFHGMPVRIVSVSELLPDWYAWLPPESGPAVADVADATAEEAERLEAWVADEARSLREAGIQASAEVRHGDAATEIVKAAAERGADLIVTGSRGLTPLASVVLGSVSRKVLANARCSVLIARIRSR